MGAGQNQGGYGKVSRLPRNLRREQLIETPSFTTRVGKSLTTVVTGHGLRYPVEISENSRKLALLPSEWVTLGHFSVGHLDKRIF